MKRTPAGPSRVPDMCQAIETVYGFCGCPGARYQQRCPTPSATCAATQISVATPLYMHCYCADHAKKSFTTVRQAQRGRTASDREDRRGRRRAISEARRRSIEAQHGRATEFRRRQRDSEQSARSDASARSQGGGRRGLTERPPTREKVERKSWWEGQREKSDGICRVM